MYGRITCSAHRIQLIACQVFTPIKVPDTNILLYTAIAVIGQMANCYLDIFNKG
jgi:hypothetical protein